MNRWILVVAVAVTVLSATGGRTDESTSSLRILYLGNPDSPRAKEFETFLKKHFATVTLAKRDGFTPAAAAGADVVLLDWSQSEGDLAKTDVPLGRFDDWTKPTVLLNHAGLLVAAHWQLIGGSG